MSLSKLDREILNFVAQHPASSLLTIDFGVEKYSKSSKRERIKMMVAAGVLTEVKRPTFKLSSAGKGILEGNRP